MNSTKIGRSAAVIKSTIIVVAFSDAPDILENNASAAGGRATRIKSGLQVKMVVPNLEVAMLWIV